MRRAVAVAVAAAWWLVSCRDVPAPEGGVMSISPLILPAPGLVVGDTLRDSLGFAAPLQLIAYDLDGNPVTGVQATFVALDTGAHVEGVYLIGDDTVATRVVGAVAGLQSSAETVKVTLEPQQLSAVDSIRRTLTVAVADTIAAPVELRARVVNLQGSAPKGIEAVIVRYEIVSAPPASSGTAGATALLLPGNVIRSRDTSDASGNVARQLLLRLIATPSTHDSAVVTASTSYRGQSLGTVQFTVVFVKQ